MFLIKQPWTSFCFNPGLKPRGTLDWHACRAAPSGVDRRGSASCGRWSRSSGSPASSWTWPDFWRGSEGNDPTAQCSTWMHAGSARSGRSVFASPACWTPPPGWWTGIRIHTRLYSWAKPRDTNSDWSSFQQAPRSRSDRPPAHTHTHTFKWYRSNTDTHYNQYTGHTLHMGFISEVQTTSLVSE